jgi:soluble lytic murein transglycosylase
MTLSIIRLLLALRLLTLPLAVQNLSVQAGVNPTLAACIITAESQWETDHLGDAGEIGLMQILPDTGEWAAQKLGMESYDLHDPVDNLRIGLWILKTFPEFFHTLYLCED